MPGGIAYGYSSCWGIWPPAAEAVCASVSSHKWADPTKPCARLHANCRHLCVQQTHSRLAKLERNRDARWLELVQPHTTQQRCKAKTAETKTPMLHTDANKPCAAGPGHPVIGNEKPVPCSPTPSGLKCCILLCPPLRSNEVEKKSIFCFASPSVIIAGIRMFPGTDSNGALLKWTRH